MSFCQSTYLLLLNNFLELDWILTIFTIQLHGGEEYMHMHGRGGGGGGGGGQATETKKILLFSFGA